MEEEEGVDEALSSHLFYTYDIKLLFRVEKNTIVQMNIIYHHACSTEETLVLDFLVINALKLLKSLRKLFPHY